MKEFNFIKKSNRAILTMMNMTDKGLIGTDLETYLLVKNVSNLNGNGSIVMPMRL